jgi:hypothetical protein
VGRLWTRRGRAPTASRAPDGVAWPFVLENDIGRVAPDLGVTKAVIACG